MVTIDLATFELQRAPGRATLLIHRPPFGLAVKIEVEELERLARYLTREALAWRRECPVPAVDYYTILGVPRQATADEIQQAYRTQAKRAHPDTSAQDTTAAMQRLNEAYAMLSDPEKRNQYDQTTV
ncbi:MAG: J domain-containing protein [Nitrospiraceae bacterium]|nr:J domain-containing protein [Nitrospiraceae bacterium]